MCPDCRDEHSDPYEAVFGHLVRCAPCGMLAESLELDRYADHEIAEVRLAA